MKSDLKARKANIEKINTRFIASLTANILRSIVSFLTALLLARWLGPEDFGRMAFLLATFMAFKGLLDMASSSAFFTFISQKPRSKYFITLFWRWVLIQVFFSLVVVLIVLPDSILDLIWQGENRSLIVLALIATFMQQNVWSVASQMAEAQRETIRVQRLNTLVVTIHLCVVLALWLLGELFIPLIFIALIFEWMIASWIAEKMYQRQKDVLESRNDTISSVFYEFWHYCKPFIPYVWLSFSFDFVSRWMLQNWDGGSEQAYFAISQQFSSVALLATTSILRIFWKEIAEAKHNGDDKRVQNLYKKTSRLLYFIGAVVVGGLVPWAKEIINLLLGPAYLSGVLTFTLMLFYPLHQSMGQICGTMFYATENTRIQVVIGSIFMALGVVVVYFLLAPKDAIVPGLGMASRGLAMQMVVMQLIQVNIMAWFIARIFGWKFDWLYQLVGLSTVVVFGWAAKLITTSIFYFDSIILIMIMSTVIYLIAMVGVLMTMPWLAGLQRKEILDQFSKFLRLSN